MEEITELFNAYLNASTASTDIASRLNHFVKEPNAPQMLLQTLLFHGESKHKKLAALLLKKRMLHIWEGFEDDTKKEWRIVLLKQLTTEADSSVRHSISQLIAAVAELCFTEWQEELYGFIGDAMKSQVVAHRVDAMYLLSETLVAVKYGEIPVQASIQLLYSGLSDPDEEVKFTALSSGKLIVSLCSDEEEIKAIKGLTRHVVVVLQQAINSKHDIGAQDGMEFFDVMMETPDLIDTSDIPDLVRFILLIAKRTDLDIGLRDQAMNIVQSAMKNKPKVLSKSDLLSEILGVLIPMGAEPEDPEEVEDEDCITAHLIACESIDSLALYLPHSRVYKAVTEGILQYTRSANPHERKCALAFVGIMSEGCKAIMKNKLNELLPFVFSSFNDNEIIVRIAAAQCLSQFAEYLQPEILIYHQESMTCLIRQIEMNDNKMQEKCFSALELFCENMEMSEIKTYLDELMPFLMKTLTTSNSSSVRASCLGTVSAIAHAAKELFEGYANELFGILKLILEMEADDETLLMKAKAIGVVGNIAKSLTVERFAPYRPTFMSIILEMMKGNDYLIKEQGFYYFANLAEAMKEQFAEYVDPVIEHTFSIIMAESDGSIVKNEGDEQSDDEQMDSVDSDYRVQEGYAAELDAAALCLRELWESCPAQCIKHFERTETCIMLIGYSIHSAASEETGFLIKAVMTALQKNASMNIKQLTAENKQIWEQKFWPIMQSLIRLSCIKQTVSDSCTALGSMCEELGSDLIKDHVTEIVEVITSLFNCNHVCQELEDIDQDEESRIEEEYLFDGVRDLISGIAKCIGVQFSEIYRLLHHSLLKFANHKKSLAYSSIGLGCVAEVFKAMGAQCEPYVESFLPPMLRGINQTDNLLLRRNAVFCAGALIQAVPMVMVHLNTIEPTMNALYPIFTSRDALHENEHAVLDNAISVLGSMMLHIPFDKLPAQLVSLFLNGLPLEDDFEENEVILKTLIHLVNDTSYQPLVQNNLLPYLRASALHICLPKEYSKSPELTQQLTQCIKELIMRMGCGHPILKELYDSLNEEVTAQQWVMNTINIIGTGV